MRVYRGPSSKPSGDESHEFVAKVSPEMLSAGIRGEALIRFDIAKDFDSTRRSACTIIVDQEDLFPILEAVICRLKREREALKEELEQLETCRKKLGNIRDAVTPSRQINLATMTVQTFDPLSPEQKVEEVRKVLANEQ